MAKQKSNEESKIRVSFTSPRTNSRVFEAEVSPDCTGKMAIEHLLVGDASGPFLERTSLGRPYELVVMRTEGIISPNTTFQEAEVIGGDIIEIRQAGQGGLDLTEIGTLVLSSGITLTALKGLIQIALKLIENEGKKTVTIKLQDGELTVQGPGADEKIKMVAEILSKYDGDFQITVSDKLPNPSSDGHGP
jgi:hypothetical protein